MPARLSLPNIFNALAARLNDEQAVRRLRRDIDAFKARDYDRVNGSLVGLYRALETQERANADLERQLTEKERTIQALKDEYTALKRRDSADEEVVRQAEQREWFNRLKPVLTQGPTLRRAVVVEQADIPAADIVGLLEAVREAAEQAGITPIGEAGELLAFDPTRHKAVGQGARSLSAGDKVRVRYVGYMQGADVLVKAEVTAAERKSKTEEA